MTRMSRRTQTPIPQAPQHDQLWTSFTPTDAIPLALQRRSLSHCPGTTSETDPASDDSCAHIGASWNPPPATSEACRTHFGAFTSTVRTPTVSLLR